MPTITDIADAVVSELNSASFSHEFQAERQYLPIYDLADVKDLRVTVVPRGMNIEPVTRSDAQHDVEIDVAVQQKLAKTDAATIDPLMALVEEIADRFRFLRFDAPPAAWIETRNEPVYAQEHLDRFRVFTSVLTFVFRVVR